jgi:S1/P1 Nuclease
MRRALSFLGLLVFLLRPGPVLAWAPEGHQVVAAIAERELTPKARAQVAALLGGEAMMVLQSSWADEIRDQRPETTSWHYVNIEIGSGGYNAGRDCGDGNCVVAQIERDRRVLSDPHAPQAAKAEALRFLIHFVADLHQPLHAADRNDKGGNEELVRLRTKRTSLHQIWDQDVVTALGQDSARVAAQIDSSLTPQQKAQLRAGTPEAWANESFAIAGREIYAKLPPTGQIRLPDDYADAESGVTRLQLARAGLRLAAILNGIWP